MEKKKEMSHLNVAYDTEGLTVELTAWLHPEMKMEDKADALGNLLTRIIRDSGIPAAKVTDKIIINLGLVECYANGADI